jgi:hypothetical protein
MVPSRQNQGPPPRRAFGAELAHDSASVARCSRVASHGPPSTTSPSALVAWRFWPLHTFGAEGHPSTPSAPKASAIRDGRRGLFLRNNTHKTQAASMLSLNHQSTLHQNNPESHADRNRTPGRTWHDASEDHFPQQHPYLTFQFFGFHHLLSILLGPAAQWSGESAHAARGVALGSGRIHRVIDVPRRHGKPILLWSLRQHPLDDACVAPMTGGGRRRRQA